MRKYFQRTAWQRCQTHFSRNVLDACPNKLMPEMKQALRSLYEANDYKTAVIIRDRIAEQFLKKCAEGRESAGRGV